MLLTSEGIPAALRALAREASTPIHVAAEGVGRYPADIESAVYFTCIEAVQNATKHAVGSRAIWITVGESDRTLTFEVRDDGAGFAAGDQPGQGLQNMRERIEAIGGHVSIQTEPDHGTRVRGVIALPAAYHVLTLGFELMTRQAGIRSVIKFSS